MFAFLKKEPIIFLLGKMWRFAGVNKKTVILFWTLSSIGNLIWLLPPIVFGLIINEVQVNGLGNVNYLYVLIGGLFLVDLVGWVFHGPARIIENIAGFKIDRNYKKYLYNGVLSLPLSWHTDHDSGDTIDKINKSTLSLYNFARNTIDVVKVLIRALGTTAVLVYFNVYLGIIAFAMLALTFYVIFQFDKRLVPQYKEINTMENKASAKVFDSLSNITTVKVLGIQVPILDSIMNSSWASFSIFRKNSITLSSKWFTGGMFFTGLIVVPIVFYIWFQYTHSQVILVGTLATLYLSLQNLVEVYYTFTALYEDVLINKTCMQNVEEIEDQFNKFTKAYKQRFKYWADLEIKNLNFGYGAITGKQEFNDFSLRIRHGEKIAFIGESGSGKSTLLKILHGMYEMASAEVSIDGGAPTKTNFADLDLESTLVPQEPEVFSASIRENITLLLDFTDEEIRRASDAAMFTDVIEQLPRKIDSVVNEKGVNLSGGQKQRLALTRALLFSKDKKIMLLDESTSSVDPTNEVKIYQNIFENFRDATIIASIHKMNLLKYFDRIVILDKGAIRNQGSFNELLAVDAEFKKSWDEFVLSHKGEEV